MIERWWCTLKISLYSLKGCWKMIFEYISIVFALILLLILFSLHFLKQEFDPAWRMISEYEIGRYGWLMRIAFFSFGINVLSLMIATWPYLQSINGTICRWWFVLLVIALFGAGIFKTNPITDRTPNWINTMHTLCGVIVILSFPIIATLVVRSWLYNSLWSANRILLIFGTVLVWIGVISFFTSITISKIKDSLAGEVGSPHVYQGWPNRFMVVTYVIWIIIISVTALRL